MAFAQTAPSNRADAVGEIVTEATVVALNSALADRGIGAERIISILPVAAQTLVTAMPAQFRVLYRAA
jgi:hypothetical protein